MPVSAKSSFGRRTSALLEIPLSIGFTGVLGHFSVIARALTMYRSLSVLHVPGVLSHLGLLDRVVLTPEGVTFEEQRRLTRAMLRRGYRVFSLTFHSPSLAPGNTPYMRNSAELRSFLRCIEQYLEIGGRPTTPLEVKEAVLASRPTVCGHVASFA